jgi:hypothetical protein
MTENNKFELLKALLIKLTDMNISEDHFKMTKNDFAKNHISSGYLITSSINPRGKIAVDYYFQIHLEQGWEAFCFRFRNEQGDKIVEAICHKYSLQKVDDNYTSWTEYFNEQGIITLTISPERNSILQICLAKPLSKEFESLTINDFI